MRGRDNFSLSATRHIVDGLGSTAASGSSRMAFGSYSLDNDGCSEAHPTVGGAWRVISQPCSCRLQDYVTRRMNRRRWVGMSILEVVGARQRDDPYRAIGRYPTGVAFQWGSVLLPYFNDVVGWSLVVCAIFYRCYLPCWRILAPRCSLDGCNTLLRGGRMALGLLQHLAVGPRDKSFRHMHDGSANTR